jgi:NAD(P)-dependent dehydrogenase (short-subunit alcohol dehydrogenase family)
MDLAALLHGQRVLVTGASSGLGAHFACVLARCGCRLVLGARRIDKLQEVAPALRELGALEVLPVPLDVTDAASVAAAFEAIAASGPPLDVVVNNAGIPGEGIALTQSVEQFDAVIATNLRGVWLVATQAARGWKQLGRGGAIVNIASIQAERTAPGLSAYSASKAGVVHLTRSLALEWARHGIRINALEPGYIRTEINDDLWEQDYGRELIRRIPMRRIGRPEDLDGMLLLMASGASSWMTGSVVAVDGGHLVSAL